MNHKAAFRQAHSSDTRGYNDCTAEIRRILRKDAGVEEVLTRALDVFAEPDFWSRPKAEQAAALPKFQSAYPSNDVMIVFVQALAHQHGVVTEARDTAPRFTFFTQADRWLERFETVAGLITQKYQDENQAAQPEGQATAKSALAFEG